ncbi:MAG: DUF3459 domain-containing protein, partial [bacterium]
EIGMLGAKPDERLRTPMQWSAAPGGGFTRGTPWERFQDDSAITTVEAQERDSLSLLNFHRRLIHLRDTTPALAHGRLVPLTVHDAGVAAYVRRDGNRSILVIANLASTPVEGVTLNSLDHALPAGSWTLRNLLDGTIGAPLSVRADGRLRDYLPLATLAPMNGYLFELSAARRPRTSTR